MLTDATLEQGLGMIGRAKLVLKETVIPSHYTNNGNSPYRPEYEWLYLYERKLAVFLKPWMASLRSALIGENGVLSEALSNAFCHGHKKDPLIPIDISVFLGRQGLIISIKDTGPGFDIRDRKSTRLNSSHNSESRMPSSA
jgi:hypothetical protein